MDAIIKECETLDLSWLESTIGDFHLVVEQKAISSTVYSIFYYAMIEIGVGQFSMIRK